MFLSKVFAEAKREAVSAFILTLLAALVIASISLHAMYASDLGAAIFDIVFIGLVFFFAIAFCGPAEKPIGEEEIWGNIFASIWIMAILLFGFEFGLLHGLYSEFITYWPYSLGAIIAVEEALYWLDDAKIQPNKNKYTFTVQKKLEAFFEILLGLGAAGLVAAAPSAFSKAIGVLSDAAIVIGGILLLAGFIWVNSLKWKTPKSPVEFDEHGNLKQMPENKSSEAEPWNP